MKSTGCCDEKRKAEMKFYKKEVLQSKEIISERLEELKGFYLKRCGQIK